MSRLSKNTEKLRHVTEQFDKDINEHLVNSLPPSPTTPCLDFEWLLFKTICLFVCLFVCSLSDVWLSYACHVHSVFTKTSIIITSKECLKPNKILFQILLNQVRKTGQIMSKHHQLTSKTTSNLKLHQIKSKTPLILDFPLLLFCLTSKPICEKIEYTATILKIHLPVFMVFLHTDRGWKANPPCCQNASETSPVHCAYLAAQTCTAGVAQCGMGQ